MIDYIYIRSWCALYKVDRAETRRRLKQARRLKAPEDAVTAKMSATGAHVSGFHTMASLLALDAMGNAEATRLFDALTQMGATYTAQTVST